MYCRCAITAAFLIALSSSYCKAQNPIQTENARAGTPNWQLSNPAVNREIEGYASLTSVNIGGSIKFSVSTTDLTFNIDIFRTGWYGGAGARLLTTVSNLTGVHRNTPSPDANGMVECNWASSYTLSVPTSWVSGIYLARLTGSSGKQSYILFVVRDDNRASDLLFESSVTTFQAYNFWPGGANGKSLYDFAPGGRAWKVSFNRPYVLGMSYTDSTTGAATGLGAGEYLANLQPGPAQGTILPPAGFEINMVRWLEQNGYDVTYLTNVDVHENAVLLRNHKAFLSVGHNEYWSMLMRQNIQDAFAKGLNLGFFSSNTLYWQIRLEPSPRTGAADRTVVCYKYDAPSQDPQYNSNPSLATVRWREAPVNQPEAALVGNEYFGDPVESDIVISNASHWLLNGTGLRNGDHIPGILGYEVDTSVPGTSPGNIQFLARSPVDPIPNDYDNPPGFSCNTQSCTSDTLWYSGGHAFVFATGSLQWSWGLDDYNAPDLRSAFSSGAAQQITRNVLGAFINSVTITTASLRSGTQGQAYGPVQLGVSGGGPPYTWSATGLPSGISLSPSGVLGGTPTTAGTSNITFTVTDDALHTGTATLSLTISPASGTFTISGQITSSGTGLNGVAVALNTGPTTTTNSSGVYSFTGLPSGSYTVTPSRSGYTFNPSTQSLTVNSNQTANFTASVSTAPARAVSINFGDTTMMGASESAGVVAKNNWNSAPSNASSTPLALKDETGASNGATATWTADNTWTLSITNTAGNPRMMQGYLDTGNKNPTTVNIAGLPAFSTGYDIYVYTDGSNPGSTRTATYSLSGAGITTTTITAIDPADVNFSGTFTQSSNSNGNYVKFSSIQATAFTLTATPVSSSADSFLRAPINGIQIVPSPATSVRAVSINFGDTTTMGGSESAGVVAKNNWNSATGNASSTPLALKDETGASNGATVTWTADNTWTLSITDTAGNPRMMNGYLDTGNQSPTTVNIAGLPASSTGYDIYVYTDGSNPGSTRTATYFLSGAGITTTTITAIDPANVNFSGTFTQSSNSNGNYVKFSSIRATAFTLTARPVSSSADSFLRAPINGIQVVPH